MPLGEVARRMGHSGDTLVSTYLGALADDEQIADERTDVVLNDASKPSLTVVS